MDLKSVYANKKVKADEPYEIAAKRQTSNHVHFTTSLSNDIIELSTMGKKIW